MANDIIDLSKFQGQRPSAVFQALNDENESLSDGIGQSYGVLGYKGKVWTLRYRGETHTFIRPDDGTTISYIDVVILRQGRGKSKSWYPRGYEEGQSQGVRPSCNSLNGIVPDLDSEQPQAQACSLCPRNAWKKMPNGRNGRECTDYKRLAVLLLPTQTKAFFGGSPLLEPVFLRVPPASLNDLSIFGDTMKSQGYHFATLVTRVSFDPTAAYPQLKFRPLQLLTDAEAQVVLPLRSTGQALRITGEDQEEGGDVRRLAAPAHQDVNPQSPEAMDAYRGIGLVNGPVTKVLERAADVAGPQPTVIEPPPMLTVRNYLAEPLQQPTAAIAPPPAPAPAPAPAPTSVDTGFGAVMAATEGVEKGRLTAESPLRAAPAAQQAAASEDVGIAPASSDLNARIAALLTTQK